MISEDEINPDIPPPEIISGVPWYREEDYPRILEVMRDPDLPSTHAEWLRQAESEERKLQGEGRAVVRIVINSKEFFSWCLEKGLTPESTACSDFILWKLWMAEMSKDE